MAEQLWQTVDDYLVNSLLTPDPVLDAAQARAAEAGLPSIAVSATQGKQLMLLVRALGARRVLEVGTLGAYSTIWMAYGLAPGGHIDTCELDPRHAEVARENLARAGFSDVVDVHVGPASETLARLQTAGGDSYDFVFIDADKENNAAYARAALAMSRQGTVIIVDNVVRDGRVATADSTDPSVVGTRALFDFAASEPRLEATAIQTVGHKGYDGFAMMVVVA